MLQLSPMDAQFLYMESDNNLAHVTSVSIFDPGTVPGKKAVRFADIVEHIRSRLPMSPFLKRKLVRVPLELDYPYWADDEHFNLEAHMHHGRLPQPADWQQFCTHVARYHSKPLDMSRPAWELYMIEGLDNIDGIPRGSYAIATKVHHAAADGASLMRFFGTLLDLDNKGTPSMQLDHVAAPVTEKPGMLQMAQRAVQNNLTSPIKMLTALRRAAPGVYEAAQKLLLKDSSKSSNKVPLTRFNADLTPHKVFDAVNFDLADFKTLRQLVPHSTINDVVLTVCGGALREYLIHHDELPDDPLVAWVPVNGRAKDEVQDDKLGNNLKSMTAALGTHLADPVQRMQEIVRITRDSKEAREATPAIDMTDITRHIPVATQIFVSRLVLRAAGSFRACNLFVSNVPGPPQHTYMVGAKNLITYGLAPLSDGMGLFIATPSYAGMMTFTVICTREVMPDISFFVDCLARSLDQLKAEAANRGIMKAHASVAVRRKKRKAKKKTSRAGKAASKKAARKAVKKTATRITAKKHRSKKKR